MKHKKTTNFKLYELISPVSMIILVITLLFMSLAGCYIPHNGNNSRLPRTGDSMRGPMIEAVKASCHFNYDRDNFVWYFDAWVHYPRHDFEDIADVYVEVFDGPYMVDWFPLYHDRDKYWQSSWIETIETDLWCGQYYEFDFIAVDHFGIYDVVTTTPYY